MLSEGGSVEGTEIPVELAELFKFLPKVNEFWHYEGGLTTPPCIEAVNWYVNKHIIRLNKK